MDYEKKFLIGDYVKGTRTFNGEVIEGKFNGFRLYNKLNPKSVVGIIDTYERCYDVSVDSIELVESEDEKIRKDIIAFIERNKRPIAPVPSDDTLDRWIALLEKQGNKKSLSTEETELNSLAFLTGLGYTCIHPMKENQMMDLWEYIKEFKDKFGRLPKDEDELAVCIDYVMKRKKPAWSKEDEKKRQLLIKVLEVNHPNAHFKVNPINTTNMEAMSSKELVEWLKSLKERVQPQPKQEWSDEDEFRLNRTVENIELLNDANGNILLKDIEWLKSLKDRLSKVKNC